MHMAAPVLCNAHGWKLRLLGELPAVSRRRVAGRDEPLLALLRACGLRETVRHLTCDPELRDERSFWMESWVRDALVDLGCVRRAWAWAGCHERYRDIRYATGRPDRTRTA